MKKNYIVVDTRDKLFLIASCEQPNGERTYNWNRNINDATKFTLFEAAQQLANREHWDPGLSIIKIA